MSLSSQHRAYMAQYAELSAARCVDHFEEFAFTEMQKLVDAGTSGEVVEYAITLMYECYWRGLNDGCEQTQESWRLAAGLLEEP
jgi:hypothetical protein